MRILVLSIFLTLISTTASFAQGPLYLEDFLRLRNSNSAEVQERIQEFYPGIRFLRIQPVDPSDAERFYDEHYVGTPLGEFIPTGAAWVRDHQLPKDTERPLVNNFIIRLKVDAPPVVALHEFAHFLIYLRAPFSSVTMKRSEIIKERLRTRGLFDDAASRLDYEAMTRHQREQDRLNSMLNRIHYDEENLINRFLLDHADDLGLSIDEIQLLARRVLIDRAQFVRNLPGEQVPVFSGHERVFERAAFELRFPHFEDIPIERLGFNWDDDVSDEQVRKAYLKARRFFEPDLNQNDPYALRAVQAYTSAYIHWKDEAGGSKRWISLPDGRGSILRRCRWVASNLGLMIR